MFFWFIGLVAESFIIAGFLNAYLRSSFSTRYTDFEERMGYILYLFYISGLLGYMGWVGLILSMVFTKFWSSGWSLYFNDEDRMKPDIVAWGDNAWAKRLAHRKDRIFRRVRKA